MSIAVSVIIPACNAATTIGQTLASVVAQEHSLWEAVVVNDFSADGTKEVIEAWARHEPRIRCIDNPVKGLAAARNLGIGMAENDWILFLDADDWISTQHLKNMTAAVLAGEELDAVVCGWRTVTQDGTESADCVVPASGEMFPLLARSCAFIIHACLVRRQKLMDAGLFDPAIPVCEDWDLWQRVARTGARFGFLNEVHAFYRMLPGSVSRNRTFFFETALRVLRQAFSEDGRVLHPDEKYRSGLPKETLPAHELYWACWCAGLFLATGEDARFLLSKLGNTPAIRLEAKHVAANLVDAVCRYVCLQPSSFYRLWEKISKPLNAFLAALEVQTKCTGLQRDVLLQAEALAARTAVSKMPLLIGKTMSVTVDVSEPIRDTRSPDAERIYFHLEAAGEPIGALTLPFIDGTVSAWILKDAIAAKYAWQILQRFFSLTVYSDESYHRGQESWEALHNRIGWDVFLQQLWNRPHWGAEAFYTPSAPDETAARSEAEKGQPVRVEISEPLASFSVATPVVDVRYSVAGLPVDVLELPVKKGLLTAQEIRAALCQSTGFELCRICVREGLLGQSFAAEATLRHALQKAAAQRLKHNERDGSSLPFDDRGAVVLRRRPGMMGSTAFRRAVLPGVNYPELLAMASAGNESFVEGAKTLLPEKIVYRPEIFSVPSAPAKQKDREPVQPAPLYGRHHFETLFSRKADPWQYTHPYEQKKYEQTLLLLQNKTFDKALEIACAEGHFTVQLAPRVKALDALDISEVALARAAERCGNFAHIRFERKDLMKDDLPGGYDLIVCSEVLYYAGEKKDLDRVAKKLARALAPGGCLVMAHGHQVIDEPDKPGFDWGLPYGGKAIGERFAKSPLLRLAREIRTPLYRVQLFQRRTYSFLPWKKKAQIEHRPQEVPVKKEVAPSVRWNGGAPSTFLPDEAQTDKLPILLYHQVVPKDERTDLRFQISTEAFEQQLRYLVENDYYSPSWESWLLAMHSRKPLKGRAVKFTFDDGTQDFYDHAWPLLKKYGFTATVFLVTEKIGQESDWELHKNTPLMDWAAIKALQKEGVEFGSHTATHRSLTALSAEEIVKEAATSRTALLTALQTNVGVMAYPFGDSNDTVKHLVGACGYTIGVEVRDAACGLGEDWMALPRLEVKGTDDLQTFICKLSQ